MSNIVTPNPKSKWVAVKEALKDGLSPKKAKMFDHLLENTRREYVAQARKQAAAYMLTENASASAMSVGNIAMLNKVILPIMRRVMPNVIANELIGVQPMPGPIAQITTVRNVYANTRAGAIAGEEMLAPLHVRDIAAAYSGNENTTTPAGAATAQLEGVPGNAVRLEVLKQVVEARTRRLSARWTIESMTDAQNMYSIDMEEELMTLTAQDITVEIDQEILRSLRSLPATPTAANTYDQSSVSGQATSVVDEFAALAVLMNRQANLIATRTRLGKGNWAVVSPTALTVLESARASAFARTTEGNFEAPTNTKYVGTLNNGMRLYTDVYADDDTPVLVGFKGDNELNAATFFCPYVPLTTHGVVTDPATFEYVTSFITRYGYVEFVNTATSLGNSADYLGLVGINASSLTFL